MGVTIHFEGKLVDEASYRSLIETAAAFAQREQWLTETFESENIKLARVRDEKDWDYYGPVKGIQIYPHEDCEPVRLEFDRGLYIQQYTKTQFAGAQIHLKVVALLKAIGPFFSNLRVEDEGEYWETGDVDVLKEHMNRVQDVIDQECAKNPSARVKFRTPSGRIVDLIT